MRLVFVTEASFVEESNEAVVDVVAVAFEDFIGDFFACVGEVGREDFFDSPAHDACVGLRWRETYLEGHFARGQPIGLVETAGKCVSCTHGTPFSSVCCGY